MGIETAINFDDLRRAAKRRLPRIAFDFIEGGVDGEQALTHIVRAYERYRLVPRYLVDASRPVQTTTLFGREYASPFGIGPTGGIAFFRPGGDLMLAKAARSANLPFVISGSSTATIEEVAAVAPEHSWYQIYMARDRSICDDMIARADAANLSTIMLTVDVPGAVNRERNKRNGYARIIHPTWSTKFEALTHPAWLYEYATTPRSVISNWVKYAPPGSTPEQVVAFMQTQHPVPSSWEDVARIRKLWPRNFVIKGIMHPDDARRAVQLGVDGIVVSSHGGRQLDRAPSPLEVFPSIKQAVGDMKTARGQKVTLMLDSGIRRGSDILTALALGTDFCWVGRWTLFGAVAGGQTGATHAVNMIRTDMEQVMRQMGCRDVAELGPDWLMDDAAKQAGIGRRRNANKDVLLS
jgi:(S)-mandelate dehydrogenase